MNPFLEKVERIVNKIIPYAVILLLLVIIYELFFHVENENIQLAVHIIDGIVIAIFVVDLIFLWIRSKTARFFFKNYWLDIVAIFPFGLMLDVVTKAYRAFFAIEQLGVGQAILHESLEARKGVKLLARSGEAAKYVRYVRVGARILRVVTKSRLFTKHVPVRGKKTVKRKK